MPQGDVYREVSAGLSILPGSVQRIDDPDAVGRQAHIVIDTLFAQESIVWPVLSERRRQQLVRRSIALLAKGVRAPGIAGLDDAEGIAEREQDSARLLGDLL